MSGPKKSLNFALRAPLIGSLRVPLTCSRAFFALLYIIIFVFFTLYGRIHTSRKLEKHPYLSLSQLTKFRLLQWTRITLACDIWRSFFLPPRVKPLLHISSSYFRS